MKRAAFALALAGAVSAGGADSARPGVEADGAPDPDPALVRAVSGYLKFGTTRFQDWRPGRRDLLVSTRAGSIEQLHLLTRPEAVPRAWSAFPEPVAEARFRPGFENELAFTSDVAGNEWHQLSWMNAERGRVRPVSDGDGRVSGFRWSNDGRWLVWGAVDRDGATTALMVMDAEPRSARHVCLLPGSGWVPLDVSRDGGRILVCEFRSVRDSRLWIVDAATGDRRMAGAATDGPVASPGGRFTRDGEAVIAVTDRGSEFLHFERVELCTGASRRLGAAVAADVEAFDLSPDGQRIAAFFNEDGRSVLRFIDAETGVEEAGPDLPAGVGSNLRWRDDGSEVAFGFSSWRLPGEVFTVDARRGTLKQWTRTRHGAAGARSLREPEGIRLRARDGVELSGFLFRPDPRRFPGRRPALVMLHGGPELQARPSYQGRWNFLLQERGIALIHPNPRGSAGYGNRFVALDDGLRREETVEDIGEFLDWISRDPGLDPERVAVYGASYGGFMALSALARFGERLRCGVAVAAIADIPTFLANTEAGRRDLRRAEYGDERDPAMAARLRAISPLARASRIRRPVLLAHGARDPRTPIAQTEQLAAELRARGGTVWLLRAEREGHGFVRGENADHLFLRIAQFLDAWLAGDGVAEGK